MRTLNLLVPGDLATLTGGYGYIRRMNEALPTHGVEARILRLDDSFPSPTPHALDDADRQLAELDHGALAMIDGLALGAMPEVAHAHARRLRQIALVHHPLALETGLDEHTAAELFESERRALAAMRRVVVTSPTTADTLEQDYGVPRERLRVVRPGTDRAPVAHGPRLGDESIVNLLCVATLTPRKGHDVLIDALSKVRSSRWELRCVGSLTRDPDTVSALRELIAARDLSDRVQLLGELDGDALDACYRRSDAFVLASRHEGYGMVLAEALSYGLPIVSTRAGAIPDTVPDDAGLLVDVDDVPALTHTIEQLVDDAAIRERLRAGALIARERLRDWDQAAAEMAAAIDGLGVDT